MTAHAGHFHAVRFYNDSDSLCRIVGEFVGTGFAEGEPAIVIATPAHMLALDNCLRQRGLDPDYLKRRGDYVTMDARETLGMFMIDALPNASAFRRSIGDVIKQVTRGREK